MVGYESIDVEIPTKDEVTPKIHKAIKRQNVDFFLDDRSHNERNDVQVRVLYGGDLAFESKKVKVKSGWACCSANVKESKADFIRQSAA